MLLSIGMIVKNEEKTLRACLEGIKPILEQVESELIIADTGSTDRTADIARQFTQNVYQIEWRDDFAWARNTTLERSNGEWFMFLDADEVFQDVSEIVKFFNSGEYKNYKCANHLRREMGHGIDTMVMRLYKKESGTKFYGRIHEIIPPESPVKKLGSVSLHSGYYEDGDGKTSAKDERNLRILLKEYEDRPGDLSTVAKIIGTANSAGDGAMAERFLAIGIKLGECDPSNVFYHSIRRGVILRLYESNKNQEAVDEIRSYFSTAEKLFSFAVHLRLIEGNMLDKLGKHGEALTAYKQAKDLFDEYKAGRVDTQDEDWTVSEKLSEDTGIYAARGIAMQYSWLGDFDAAFEYIKEYGLNVSELLAPMKRDGEVKGGVFEEYVKMAYKYLLLAHNAESFDGVSANDLPGRDRFIYFAKKAYERRAGGDIYGFASLLRDALKLDVSLKDVAVAAIKSSADAEISPLERLKKEAAALKAAIYGLIDKNQIKTAARILEQYAKINPSDPEIAPIAAKIKEKPQDNI
ncbi:MAG: glycosyltransferase family 2 protein [Clostridiales bacterium]|jgi:glycosyltransferase involved in cell wall biosynthesis|nr:glycosyltransferase family 2 protein [Clostridiales bacterium]